MSQGLNINNFTYFQVEVGVQKMLYLSLAMVAADNFTDYQGGLQGVHIGNQACFFPVIRVMKVHLGKNR